MTPDRLALIPARGGSKRLERKNFKPLAGKPLMAWTIEAALACELFDPKSIHICSDDEQARRIAETYGVSFIDQQAPLHRDDCRDIEWISAALGYLGHPKADCYLLRPTSPFRGPDTILRAHEQWTACRDRLDSLRAVRKATETAWKQWVVEDYVCEYGCNNPGPGAVVSVIHTHWPTMVPLTTASGKKHLHSFPTQSLTPSYIQTAALEIFKADTIYRTGTIAGDQVGMFLTEGPETVNIDTQEDWEEAERVVRTIAPRHPQDDTGYEGYVRVIDHPCGDPRCTDPACLKVKRLSR